MTLTVLAAPDQADPDGNPYVELLYRAMGEAVRIRPLTRRGLLAKPDVVHVHWPEHLVPRDRKRDFLRRAPVLLALIFLARQRGAVLVWTGHNLRPHDSPHPWLDRVYYRAFLGQVDHVLTMTTAARHVLQSKYPVLRRAMFSLTRHGDYRDAYPPPPSRAAARECLGIDRDAEVLLTLGQVREYKGLPALVRAADTMPQTLLAIVGPADEPVAASALRRACREKARIRLDLRRLTEDEVVTWIAASDVLLAVHDAQSSLNSGAALLALSFDRPVVLRRSASSEELQDDVGSSWVALVDDLSEVFSAAAKLASEDRSHAALGAEYSWTNIAQATLAAYRCGSKAA